MGSRRGRGVVLLLMLAAVTSAALVISWKPLIGAISALALSTIGIALDGVMYRRGETYYFPKLLDTLLATLWGSFVILLVFTKTDWLRMYASLIILGVLCIISFISTFVGMPWVLQVAVDHVGTDLWSRVHRGTPRELAFRQACAIVTAYWALLFGAMAGGVAVNIRYNTKLADDGETLTHIHPYVNLFLSGVWSIALFVLGMTTSKRLGAYLTTRLRVRYEQRAA
eukprot:TRINITY_DN20832_c0_g1_i1.p1 TRINITY_DN20832_c0_g1~~TRINITY_DN20832_c0_g1_i1.p1  ORF type:complete len:238 (-),score=13.14 TRINITY_DN20832_c0_g1_i1:268-945(-)